MIIKPIIGPNGKMPILIRDDDTNFFTRSDMLESIYSKAWNEGFKISLSVVPFQKGIDDVCVPPQMRKTELFYSIANNERLIKLIKNKIQDRSVEILQHGFSHSIKDSRGEFGDSGSSIISLKEQRTNIEYGRNIIRQTFGIEPRFFTPPHDDISKRNLELVIQELGMIPVYGQSIFHDFFRSTYIPNLLKQFVAKAIIHRYGKSGFIIPLNIQILEKSKGIILSLPFMEIIKPRSSYESLLDMLSRIISACSYIRTPICILNHYHHYFYDWSSHITRKDLFIAWQKILEYLNKLTFSWKTTFSDLYDRTRKLQRMNISKTGSKITIQSREFIEDFSFRIEGRGRLEPNAWAMFDKETNIVTIERLSPKSKVILYEGT